MPSNWVIDLESYGLNPNSAFYQLSDFGQITEHL